MWILNENREYEQYRDRSGSGAIICALRLMNDKIACEEQRLTSEG